jgi:Na+-driven multidrug efflux pump
MAKFGLALGLLLIVLTLPLQWISIVALAPEPEALPALKTYLGVRLWSAPIVMINFALLGWFYGRAAATLGMLLQIIVSGGNIILSIVFVYGLHLGCLALRLARF